MDYLYENLGDERFQELCSALIAKEFSNMQAFPVGQPDGGRDTVVYSMGSIKKEFIVFQVKFVKNPNQDRDIHKWLTETIKEEIQKIDKLVPKGAKSYYLITNVRGTAHLDTGSKDLVNKILEKNIKIPALCWWRDDLSRLVEKDPLFKWSFPEILNGQDVLNSVLFHSLNENKERRESVIKAYLVDQFDIDNEVKFKQIDLQNRLLNLFTDVPIRIKKYNQKNKELRQTLESLEYSRRMRIHDELYVIEESPELKAAEFLLHPKVQTQIGSLLLEGGPGQGKSTIAQYICQIHRAQLLNKQSDIDLLPKKIRHSPVRLPLKIDLRDISTWVEKKNPYPGTLSEEYFTSIWKNSLEAFLVAHIFYHSKLEEFSSTDFIAVCKVSPILLVFDGFDEIANLKVRSEVIEFINRGITRVSANTKSLQVIITSRPAAFSDSVGFSIDNYPHFELTDITPPIINEYVEKWIKASNLDLRDSNQLKGLIKDKLELPHLRDLTKSPMQLAIFISLLRTKGQSLPNKRTALYDSYINLFFDRESEKNSLIRDKRDLIIDIHQYLAWILHSEAELFKNSGRIHINDLTIRLKEYLKNEGHDTSIADQLFDVVKERVCALVSRIQGTFEFEVQPLREYFCAKYLYKSAPHSSAGSVKMGTKPDRLHAILRNFYWQNVVRFFSGCADAGELDMIIQELIDLQNDKILKYTNYPRILTSQILSDYVFSQKPLKMKSVVKIIVDGINIGKIVNQDERNSSTETLFLPDECGGIEIIKECFEQLKRFPKYDYASELISIINNNPLNKLEYWLEYLPQYKGMELTRWLLFAYKLQLIHKIDEATLLKILDNTEENRHIIRRLQLIINGNRFNLINTNSKLKDITFKGILNNELTVHPKNNSSSSINFISIAFNPFVISEVLRREYYKMNFMDHLRDFVERYGNHNKSTMLLTDFPLDDSIDRQIFKFTNSINSIFAKSISIFRSKIDQWDIFVENARENFEDCWALKIIATIAAGIKSKTEVYEEYSDLHKVSDSLCKRVRNARLKSGNVKYWQEDLQGSPDILFSLLVIFTWATPKTLIELLPTLSQAIKTLQKEDFEKLAKALDSTCNISIFTKAQQKEIMAEISNKKNYDELYYILSLRFDYPNGQIFIFRNVKKFTGVNESVIDRKLQYLISVYLKNPSSISTLEEIKNIYKTIHFVSERNSRRHGIQQAKIPYEIAQKIMTECKDYPRVISSIAERSCRIYANKNVIPVGETAKKGNWFTEG